MARPGVKLCHCRQRGQGWEASGSTKFECAIRDKGNVEQI